eukprot:5334486-Prymnesium_polylepis.1
MGVHQMGLGQMTHCCRSIGMKRHKFSTVVGGEVGWEERLVGRRGWLGGEVGWGSTRGAW